MPPILTARQVLSVLIRDIQVLLNAVLLCGEEKLDEAVALVFAGAGVFIGVGGSLSAIRQFLKV